MTDEPTSWARERVVDLFRPYFSEFVVPEALVDAITTALEEAEARGSEALRRAHADIEQVRAERDGLEAELGKFDCRLQDAVDRALSMHDGRTKARNDGYEYGKSAERTSIIDQLENPSEAMVEALADAYRDPTGKYMKWRFLPEGTRCDFKNDTRAFLRALAATLRQEE